MYLIWFFWCGLNYFGSLPGGLRRSDDGPGHRGNHKSPEPQTRLLQCFFIWNSTSGTFVPSYQGAPKAAV